MFFSSLWLTAITLFYFACIFLSLLCSVVGVNDQTNTSQRTTTATTKTISFLYSFSSSWISFCFSLENTFPSVCQLRRVTSVRSCANCQTRGSPPEMPSSWPFRILDFWVVKKKDNFLYQKNEATDPKDSCCCLLLRAHTQTDTHNAHIHIKSCPLLPTSIFSYS